MKQVKLLIALLAVVFSAASAFTPHAKFALTYYSYISGKTAANASAWTHTADPASCPATTGGPCVIKANPGTGTHPLQADVTTIKNNSSTFTSKNVAISGGLENLVKSN